MNVRRRGRKMKRMIAGLAIAINVFAAGRAIAESSSIVVEHAWARASPKSATNGAAYVTLVNNGPGDDRLLQASSPAAERVQFHSETNDNGVMKMVQLPAIDVHPGTPVLLRPGAIHMMLSGSLWHRAAPERAPF